MRRLLNAGWISAIVGSRVMLGLVVTAFTAQATWIALLARPSVYDETYHLNAIYAFSRGLTPFLRQAESDFAVGDLERYPSYLYHYLWSFPWRWTEGWVAGDRIALLRIASAVTVGLGLVAWQRVVRALGATAAVANTAVLAVSLTPMLVFLAGTVTYDNLLFTLVGVAALFAVRLYRADEVVLSDWLWFVIVTGLAALTKYSGLPFLAVLVAVVAVRQAWVLRTRRRAALAPWRPVSARGWVAFGALASGALLVFMLVVERFGINLVRFGTPLPDCLDVQDLETCQQWLPWGRNYRLDPQFPDLPLDLRTALMYFSVDWLPRVLRLWNAIGVVDSQNHALLSNGPSISGVIILGGAAAIGIVLLLLLPLVRHYKGASMLVLASAGYVCALFWVNLGDYRSLGQPVGVHGRYLLTVLPVVVGVAATLVAHALGAARKAWGAVLFILLCLTGTQGGGFTGFLVTTTPEWWRGIPALTEIQGDLSEVARRIVVDDLLVRDPRPDPARETTAEPGTRHVSRGEQ